MRYQVLGVPGELTTLPGCSQVVVSHGVYVPKEERGKGVGTNANIERQKLALEELGYDMMLCTVRAHNIAEKKILIKTGWSFLTRFLSRNTGVEIELWGIKHGR